MDAINNHLVDFSNLIHEIKKDEDQKNMIEKMPVFKEVDKLQLNGVCIQEKIIEFNQNILTILKFKEVDKTLFLERYLDFVEIHSCSFTKPIQDYYSDIVLNRVFLKDINFNYIKFNDICFKHLIQPETFSENKMFSLFHIVSSSNYNYILDNLFKPRKTKAEEIMIPMTQSTVYYRVFCASY